MPISGYAAQLVRVAQGELSEFGGVLETDPRLRTRIYDTYLAQLKAADPGDSLGWNMDPDITSWAWSATFVSWCVLAAGATLANFDFSIRHAVFTRKAIQNEAAGAGEFRGRKITDYAPQPGDLIVANRGGGTITYDQAKTNGNYLSHSAIVVDLIIRNGKRYALTVGGNESDSVRQTEVELTSAGKVKQRSPNPYVCVIQNLMGPGPALPAVPPAPAGGLPASFRKHGTFVYDAIATTNDYGSAALVAAAMTRAGMTHAWVRVHGRDPFSAARKTATVNLIAALKTAGIAVAGWGWCQGETPADEARTALRELAAYGLSDYVADIEPGHNNSVWSVSEVQTFCRKVRDGLPAGGFAVSSFALIDWHEPHLLAAAVPFVDAFAPQVYWFNYPNNRMRQEFTRPDGAAYGLHDPGAYADLCLDRWTKLCGPTPKPLILTGQTYWGEGEFTQDQAEDKLAAFLEGWSGHSRIAGLNWWHFGGGSGMSHAMLEGIVAAGLGTKSYA
jgi:hypothetical protein